MLKYIYNKIRTSIVLTLFIVLCTQAHGELTQVLDKYGNTAVFDQEGQPVFVNNKRSLIEMLYAGDFELAKAKLTRWNPDYNIPNIYLFDSYGNTALMIASIYGNFEIVEGSG